VTNPVEIVPAARAALQVPVDHDHHRHHLLLVVTQVKLAAVVVVDI
jgi:hypothetical protein